MTAKSAANLPSFAKFDFDAVVSLQKANVETMMAAQRILFDLFQTVARRQSELVTDRLARSEKLIQGFDAARQPADYMDEARISLEKAMADVKETVDLGLKAQNEVVDLFVQRATRNFEDAKALAA